jgi:hypothetical protein
VLVAGDDKRNVGEPGEEVGESGGGVGAKARIIGLRLDRMMHEDENIRLLAVLLQILRQSVQLISAEVARVE